MEARHVRRTRRIAKRERPARTVAAGAGQRFLFGFYVAISLLLRFLFGKIK
jgi:hypothetical protein